MAHFLYITWLARQAFSGLLYSWPISLILIAGLIVTAIIESPFLGSQFRRKHLLVFAPFLICLLILVWGDVMEHPSGSQSLGPAWAGYFTLGLFAFQCLIGIYTIYLMKGFRWISTFIILLQLWFGFWCAFVAAMSISGDWL